MLGKLMKYEIKTTSRTFMPLYLVLMVLSLINRFSFPLSGPGAYRFPRALLSALFTIILISLFITTLIVMISRFYKNLLSDEGYLMFTLPVKAWHHIVSKLIVSLMWIIISMIVSLMSIYIITSAEISFSEIIDGAKLLWDEAYVYWGPEIYLIAAETFIAFVLGICTSVLMIYASIALGHLSARHKVLASFGAFLLLNTISRIASSATSSLIGINRSSSSFTLTFFIGYTEVPPTDLILHNAMLRSIAISLIFSALYFAIANTILTKRLNLE